LYDVFTSTRNAEDLSMLGSNNEHTNTCKNMKNDLWLAVVEMHALDDFEVDRFIKCMREWEAAKDQG